MDVRKLLVAKRDTAQLHLDNFDKAATFAGTVEPRLLATGEMLAEGAPVKAKPGRKPKAAQAAAEPVKTKPGRKPKAIAAEPTAPAKKPRDYAAENARTKERKAAKLAAAAAASAPVDPLA